MGELNLNPDALEAAAKAEYPYLFNGKMENGLSSIEKLFTPEQARERAEKARAEKIQLIARHAGAYLRYDDEIRPGDTVENINHPDLDHRVVIGIGEEWIFLDFQQYLLEKGELPEPLPKSNYRKVR